MIMVDDGSTDSTWDIIERQKLIISLYCLQKLGF